MKIAVICKSDLRGGAAIVSYRLMNALRGQGADARMVVCDKLSDDPNVIPAGGLWDVKRPFITERLRVVAANGWSRKNLWQIDPATDGLPLSCHPWIRQADAIILNWVNQGMLSTDGLEELLKLGKPVVWTMHDKWNMTALCHHSGDCEAFTRHCENCPLLPATPKAFDFTRDAWLRKHRAYRHENLRFVGVSSWVVEEARRSSLLAGVPLSVIPNAFPAEKWDPTNPRDGKNIIAFGAARIDDPIKGLPHLETVLETFASRYPDLAAATELRLFGNLKDPNAIDPLKALPIEVSYLGPLSSEGVRDLLQKSKAVLSTSSFETLPTTLIEGLAAGALPVTFDRGGQRDIVTSPFPLSGGPDLAGNGYLIPYADTALFADSIADSLLRWTPALSRILNADIRARFSAETVARTYLDLLTKI